MCREYSQCLLPPFHKLTLYTIPKLKSILIKTCREYSQCLLPPFQKLTLYTIPKLKSRNLLHLYLLVHCSSPNLGSHPPWRTRNRLIHRGELDLSFKCSHQPPWKHYPHSELPWNQFIRYLPSPLTLSTVDLPIQKQHLSSKYVLRKASEMAVHRKNIIIHVVLYYQGTY